MKQLKSIALKVLGISLFLFLAAAAVPQAYATHSWGGYHWARTANPFTLKLGDNVSSAWDSYLGTTSSDWSVSTVLDTLVVPGMAKANCRPTSGRVEVCNKLYGSTGWLGIAQIWVSGLHITQGTVKLNDTYFNTATYNTPGWRQMVTCQEVGHTLGLDHQDTNFNNPNLGTCMDYTNDPNRDDGLGNNLHPNQHDYDELGIIYAHLDTFTTLSQKISQLAQLNADLATENPGEWGRLVRQQGRLAVFEKDFGGGFKLFTFVIFAE